MQVPLSLVAGPPRRSITRPHLHPSLTLRGGIAANDLLVITAVPFLANKLDRLAPDTRRLLRCDIWEPMQRSRFT